MPSTQLMQSLQVDLITAELFAALRAARIQAVLLKGVVIARALYVHEGDRPYSDCDVLVSDDARVDAEAVLQGLGFRAEAAPGILGHRAEEWQRSRDGAEVDLHRSFFGMRAAPPEVWAAFSARTCITVVAGQEVTTLRRDALALIIVLHAVQHADTLAHPAEDLRRAIEQWGTQDVWVGALRLAQRVDVVDLFAAGLGASAAGSSLCHVLGLRVAPRASARALTRAVRRNAVQSGATRLARIAELRGVRARAVAVAGAMFPRPAQLPQRDRPASRGGLARAYAVRELTLVLRLPQVFVCWRRDRRKGA